MPNLAVMPDLGARRAEAVRVYLTYWEQFHPKPGYPAKMNLITGADEDTKTQM